MAGMREMALGIASALRSGIAPNPLPVELRGYAPEDAAHLLKYLVDECVDAEVEVHEIRADPVVVHELSGSKTEAGVVHRGIVITAVVACRGRLELYRFSVEWDQL